MSIKIFTTEDDSAKSEDFNIFGAFTTLLKPKDVQTVNDEEEEQDSEPIRETFFLNNTSIHDEVEVTQPFKILEVYIFQSGASREIGTSSGALVQEFSCTASLLVKPDNSSTGDEGAIISTSEKSSGSGDAVVVVPASEARLQNVNMQVQGPATLKLVPGSGNSYDNLLDPEDASAYVTVEYL